jgi:hypothetical protein
MATPNAAPQQGDPLVPHVPIVPPAVVPDPNTAPPPAAPTVQLDNEDRAIGAIVNDQHVAVPHDAFRKIKDNARDKGRRETASEFDAKARSLGYPDAAAMFSALERKDPPVTTPANPTTPNQPAGAPAGAPAAAAPAAGAQPAGQPAGAPAAGQPAAGAQPGQPGAQPGQQGAKPDDEPENDRRVPDAVRKRLRQAREDMKSKTAEADRKAQAAEQKAQAAEQQMQVWKAEQGMREDLIRAGVKDLDYTWFDLKKHLESIKGDEEKLKAFEIKTWVEEQRKLRPFLFGETVVPANSAPATPPPAGPPGAGATIAAAGDASKVDARSLPAQDFNKRMAALGITVKANNPGR